MLDEYQLLPALAVPCPICLQPAGKPCAGPIPGRDDPIHARRRESAAAAPEVRWYPICHLCSRGTAPENGTLMTDESNRDVHVACRERLGLSVPPLLESLPVAAAPRVEEQVLARMDAARLALAEARTLSQAKQVADGAAAICEWLRRQSEVGLHIVNDGNLLRLEAEHRMGEFLQQPGAVRRPEEGRPKEVCPTDTLPPPTLGSLGIDRKAAQRYREVAAVPADTLRQLAATATTEGKELTREAVLRAAKNPTGTLRECLSVNSSDHFQTPPWCLLPLLPYLGRAAPIWEPAAGNGNLVGALEARGYRVIRGDILTGEDFLTCAEPRDWSCIITNPPYSKKDEFLERCYALGKPFALYLPLTALGEQKRLGLYRRHGIQLVLPHERTNFETPSGAGNGAWFFSAWFLGNFHLPRDLNFWRPEEPPDA